MISQTAVENARSTYATDGYVIAKKIFSAESIDLMARSFRSVLEKNAAPETNGSNGVSLAELTLDELIMNREAKDHSIVYKASQSLGSSAACYQLIGGSGILGAVAEATGFDPANLHLMPLYLIAQLPSDGRFDYPWHQDGAYYPWAKDMLTLWFPLNRATRKETGTISVIPGSHLVNARATESYVKHGFFRQIESKIDDQEARQETVLEMELGDCAIMHGDTVHRSVANQSSTPRVAGVMRMASIGNLPTYNRELFYCVHKS